MRKLGSEKVGALQVSPGSDIIKIRTQPWPPGSTEASIASSQVWQVLYLPDLGTLRSRVFALG